MENTLVIVDQPAELAATLELAADFARASWGDWRVFNCWCEERGLGALAASPEVVCGFLADEATRGRRASTLEGAWRPSATSPGLPGSKPLRGNRRSQCCPGSGARLALRRSLVVYRHLSDDALEPCGDVGKPRRSFRRARTSGKAWRSWKRWRANHDKFLG